MNIYSPMHPVAEYIDPAEFESLPAAARQALERIEMDPSGGSAFSIQTSAVGNWWFTLVEGHGAIRYLVRNRPHPQMYMMVAIALSGRNRAMRAPWPRAGEIVLLSWDGPSDIISAGEFRYLIAHIPIEALNEAKLESGDPLPTGFPLSAFIGVGALLYSSLRGLADQARNPALRPELELLLPEIARLILRSFSADVVKSACTDLKQNMLGRVLTYMEVHLGDNRLSAGEVARACGISKRQLFRFFKDRGESFSETLRRMRLSRARDMLLLHPEAAVSQISRTTGFSTPAHFSRIFASEIGCTPSSYRRQEIAVAMAPGKSWERGP